MIDVMIDGSTEVIANWETRTLVKVKKVFTWPSNKKN